MRKFARPLEEKNETLRKVSHETSATIQNLAREREEMFAILSSMIEGVLVIDQRERIVLANSACARMFDWRSGDVKGRPFWELLRYPELASRLKNTLEHGTFENTEISIFMPEEKILNAQISPIKSENGNWRGAVCVLHDITPIKKLERLRSEFVANVSHELKTPLTSIKGFVETLREGAMDDPEAAKKFLGIIEDQTARLERLIAELLDLAKLETKEAGLHFKPLDLKKLIEKTNHLYQERVQSKKQTFELRLPQSLPVVNADEERIEQALGNLIDNAIKFTPANGKITLGARESSDRVEISVSDNGIGIPEDHLPRIFERFYRVDKSRSREEGGTGLGLSIVKHIIQAHQGDITVESEVGKGTTFTITLPKFSRLTPARQGGAAELS